MIVLALDTSTDMLACAVVRADAAALPVADHIEVEPAGDGLARWPFRRSARSVAGRTDGPGADGQDRRHEL